ncbi:hypothetical protein Tco_0801909 [Tanacetum coccineum]|uniref:Uncharacterized protein n=1 Tax=Tanacetum coccineum TaxID=301880 RepID=A0ABQ5A071_9ASTR
MHGAIHVTRTINNDQGWFVTTVRKVMQSIGFLGPAFFLSQLSHVDSTAMAVFCMACNKFQRPGVQAVISLMAMVPLLLNINEWQCYHGNGWPKLMGTKTLSGKCDDKLYVIGNDIAEGTRLAWFRRSHIINTLIHMLNYNKADVTVFNEYPQEDDKHKAQCKVKKCFSIEERDGNVTISVVHEGERKPFIRGKKDGGFGNASKYLINLMDSFGKGLGEVVISSNSAVTHPQDGPDFMAKDARLLNYPFPYLYDHVSLSQPLWAAIQPNWT